MINFNFLWILKEFLTTNTVKFLLILFGEVWVLLAVLMIIFKEEKLFKKVVEIKSFKIPENIYWPTGAYLA